MATFKIHEDNRNENCKLSDGLHHEVKNPKRHVLGDIQNNLSRPFASLKRGVIDDSLNTVPSGFIENIKALGIKDKPAINKNDKPLLRSPHAENKGCLANKLDQKVEVFVDIDKENDYSFQSLSIPIDESREKHFLEDEVTNSSFPDCSTNNDVCHISESSEEKKVSENDENSACSETPKISRLELCRSILDDEVFSIACYKDEVYNYLKSMERKFQPSAYYMRRQPQITNSMRAILVDWLVEVGEEYNLSAETIYMTVSLTDRFLSVMAITKAKLQLLGTAAMMVASKFEEIYPPEAGAFVYITDDSYTTNQLIRMERLLLKVLQFDISAPTIYSFLTLIFSCEKVVTKIFYLAMYICELSLLEADPYLQFYPSVIASGAVVLARHCLDCKDIWPASYVKFTGYTLSQLVPVINHLNATHQSSFTSTYQAIRNKYNSPKCRCIAQVPFRKLTLREA